MISQDVDAIARALGLARFIEPPPPLQIPDQPSLFDAPAPWPGQRPQLRAPRPPQPTRPSGTITTAALAMVFVALFLTVLVSGFVSAAVLIGLFGIPYMAFVATYPAIVTLSSFFRSLPTLVAFARAKKDRAPLFIGGLIGSLLVLPATFVLAKWGVQSFGLVLPADAKTPTSYMAWTLNMSMDFRTVPDWVQHATPFVSMLGAIVGLIASTRANKKLERARLEAELRRVSGQDR